MGQKVTYLQDPTGNQSLKNQYISWMRVHNYATSTVERTEYMLSRFFTWCKHRGITQPKEVSRFILERYQRYIFNYRTKEGKPFKMTTQANHLTHVCSFFSWLAKERKILFNPASEIEMPKKEKHLPHHILTTKQVNRILSQPDITSLFGLRDRAIMETLYSTGMRRNELSNLKILDLYLEQGTVIIRQGKGRKDRMIPIGRNALEWIEKYMRFARNNLVKEPDDGYLFLTKSGRSVTPSFVSKQMHFYIKEAGITHGGSCHIFRHTMATLMLENGADIRHIQKILGHSKLETTQIYTEVSIRSLKSIHQRTHPGEQQL